MSDTSTDTAAAAPNGAAIMPITVIAQYLKDLSFENPGAGGSSEEQPQGSVQVDVRARSMGESVFEVVLALRIEAQRDAQVVYLLELEYAGTFRIGPVPSEVVEPLIMIEAPRLLFPFARQIVMNATRDGGFAPLLMNPIDFAGLYREHRQRAAQRQAKPSEGTS